MATREEKKAMREKLKANPKEMGSVYLHISNSGVSFKVIDEGWGPTVVVGSGSFGATNSEIKVRTDKKSLVALATLFLKAAKEDFSEDYCNKAYLSSVDGKSVSESQSWSDGQIEVKDGD